MDTFPATHNQPELATAPEHRFEFRATLKDFFALEIKNLILTIFTLGIYSAWATVARKQYLARHTFVDGYNFDYTAEPKVILRSRIIIALVFIATVATAALNETVYWFTCVALVLCSPWAIVASLAFHAKNTTHRGARFSFDATTKEGYVWYFKQCLLQICTLGLAFPLIHRYFNRFVINHRKLGGQPFRFDSEPAPFIKLSLQYVALLVAAGVLAMGAMMGISIAAGGEAGLEALAEATPGSQLPTTMLLVMPVMAILGYGLLFFIVGSTLARSTNLIYNHTRFGAHRFVSTQQGIKAGMIWVTNMLAVVCTMGLAYPWAMLRLHRYRFENLKIQANGPLMAGVTLDSNPGGRAGSDATGAAFVDLAGGMDFGL